MKKKKIKKKKKRLASIDAKREERSDNLVMKYYAVAFLDLLGQKDRFLKTDYMPTEGDSTAERELKEAVKDSLDAIRFLYERANMFSKLDKRIDADSPLMRLNPEDRKVALSWARPEIRNANWSDGITFYCSLDEEGNNVPAAGIHMIVASCASLMLANLALGKPIRGGLDIGTGIEASGQIFGASLVKAYELESEKAGYPRIVVGERFLDYLSHLLSNKSEDPKTSYSRLLAKRIGNILCEAADGKWMIDFLGNWGFEVFRDSEMCEMFHEADIFVTKSLQKWRTEENQKLEERYKQLADYFDNRRHLWIKE